MRPGPLHKKDEKLLIIWGRKILRQIFEPIKESNAWRIRSIVEIEHIMKKNVYRNFYIMQKTY